MPYNQCTTYKLVQREPNELTDNQSDDIQSMDGLIDSTKRAGRVE